MYSPLSDKTMSKHTYTSALYFENNRHDISVRRTSVGFCCYQYDWPHFTNCFTKVWPTSFRRGQPLWVSTAYSFTNHYKCWRNCILWWPQGTSYNKLKLILILLLNTILFIGWTDAIAWSLQSSNQPNEYDFYTKIMVYHVGAVLHEICVVWHGHGNGIAAHPNRQSHRM